MVSWQCRLLIGIVWSALVLFCQANPNPQPPAAGKFDDRAAPKSPDLKSVGVKGTIDSGGYAAPAVTSAQTRLAESLIHLQLKALRSAYTVGGDVPCGQRQSLERQVAQNQTQVVARRALASFYLQHGEPALTIDLLKPAVEAVGDPGLRQQLGLAYEQQGDMEAAEQQFRSVAIKDRNEEHTFVWGVSLLLNGESDRALAVFRGSATPHSFLLSLGESAALYNLGDGDQSLSILLQLAEMKPADPAPFELIAAILRSASPSAAGPALQRLRTLAKSAPSNAWAQYAYASAILASSAGSPDSKQIAEIEGLLEKAVQLKATLPDAHFQLAALSADRQDMAGAISEYKSAIRANPNFADAHYRLGQLYLKTGQKDLAKQEFSAHQHLREQEEKLPREQQIFEESGFTTHDRCTQTAVERSP